MSTRELQFTGDLTTVNAESVRQQFIDFLDTDPDTEILYEVVVDPEAGFDLSMIQTLIAAFRTAEDRGLTLQMQQPMPERLQYALRSG